MPDLKKFLAKFNQEERETIESSLRLIVSSNWKGLNMKKLKGYENVFLIRKGKIRIIFSRNKIKILILAIERRNENTYNFK